MNKRQGKIEKKKENGAEEIFEILMTQNFPKL